MELTTSWTSIHHVDLLSQPPTPASSCGEPFDVRGCRLEPLSLLCPHAEGFHVCLLIVLARQPGLGSRARGVSVDVGRPPSPPLPSTTSSLIAADEPSPLRGQYSVWSTGFSGSSLVKGTKREHSASKKES